MYIKNNNKIYKASACDNNNYTSYQMTNTDTWREKEKKYILKQVLKHEQAQAQALHDAEQARGYCPKCHMLINQDGTCDCGYTKPKYNYNNIGSDFQARLAAVKSHM